MNFIRKNNYKNLYDLIKIINSIVDENIRRSENDFFNKKIIFNDTIPELEKKFINILKKINQNKNKNNSKNQKLLISNYNSISTVLDRLSVEKTKYFHFKNHMKNEFTKSEIKKKLAFQKTLITAINKILLEKFIEAFENDITILSEQRTFK